MARKLINKEEILLMAEKYKKDILESWPLIIDNAQPHGKKFSSTSPFDLLLMFINILEDQPSHIIEFSPWRGYSTMVLASAMRVLDHKNSFATFEINKALAPPINKRIQENNFAEYVQIIWGNAINTIKVHLNNNPDWHVGFVFIDCNHRRAFSRRYTKEIFPKLSKGCLIFIHDVSTNANNGFCSSAPPPANEHLGIKEWVNKTRVKYVLTHKAFGGKTDASARLPIDNGFFKKLHKILGKNIMDHEESAPVCFVCRNP
jgi:predicted O-methyltransferase YrrM